MDSPNDAEDVFNLETFVAEQLNASLGLVADSPSRPKVRLPPTSDAKQQSGSITIDNLFNKKREESIHEQQTSQATNAAKSTATASKQTSAVFNELLANTCPTFNTTSGSAVTDWLLGKDQAPAPPERAVKRSQTSRNHTICHFCGHAGHIQSFCWQKYPQKAPWNRGGHCFHQGVTQSQHGHRHAVGASKVGNVENSIKVSANVTPSK